LIHRKVVAPGRGYKPIMGRTSNPPDPSLSRTSVLDASISASAPKAAKVAQLLLAHAKLCREIAARSWNEDSARKLEELADACVRAADATYELPPRRKLH
jgi:hypothetical protein